MLHRHYVGLSEADMAGAMLQIQQTLLSRLTDTRQTA